MTSHGSISHARMSASGKNEAVWSLRGHDDIVTIETIREGGAILGRRVARKRGYETQIFLDWRRWAPATTVPTAASYRQMSLLVSGLLRCKCGEDSVVKFVSGNFLRVFGAVWDGRRG
jgi:hypothetical protein